MGAKKIIAGKFLRVMKGIMGVMFLLLLTWVRYAIFKENPLYYWSLNKASRE